MRLKLQQAINRHGYIGVAKLAMKRASQLVTRDTDLRGAFASYEEALAAVSPELRSGYNHESTVDCCVDQMCRISRYDENILILLDNLLPQANILLDAGGHIGTKYRAFREHLNLDRLPLTWIVWDNPAMVAAGRRRALAEGLSHQLKFVDAPGDAPPADIILCSGLLQYLDCSFPSLIESLKAKPKHMLLNKVATRKGETVVMLNRIADAEVPYQIRNEAQLIAEIKSLGYEIIKEWVIPELNHKIKDAPRLGASTSRGYYARLRD